VESCACPSRSPAQALLEKGRVMRTSQRGNSDCVGVETWLGAKKAINLRRLRMNITEGKLDHEIARDKDTPCPRGGGGWEVAKQKRKKKKSK